MDVIQETLLQAALAHETSGQSRETVAEIETTDMGPILNLLIDSIVDHGYAVIPCFLPPTVIAQLAAEARHLQQDGTMRRAGIGQSPEPVESTIRGDVIHWLDKSGGSQARQQYLLRMATLSEELNRQLYLGLFELESHFAIYPPGAFYGQHLDQFQGNTQRQVSTILYLNEEWQPEFGGQLRLYLDGTADNPHLDIEPEGGTLVAFLSGRFYHEVLPASRERLSIAGWFSTRSTRGQAPQ